MKLITINEVFPQAPKIVLIANISNMYTEGMHLKHFKKTHNIYGILHEPRKEEFNNIKIDIRYYKDLKSKYQDILDFLNHHNLDYFSISALSFGGVLAFFLIFHFPDRIQKAIIHDFHWETHPYVNTYDWVIPKKSKIPILFLLHTGNCVNKTKIQQLISIFGKRINFFYCFTFHTNIHHYNNEVERPLEIFSKLFNYKNMKVKHFWNIFYPKWMNNQFKFKNSLIFRKLFIFLFKDNTNYYQWFNENIHL